MKAYNFCRSINDQKIRYVAGRQNCQQFVSELVSQIIVEGYVNLPKIGTIENVVSAVKQGAWASSTAIYQGGIGEVGMV